jgi:REP element-mobilizing transposase RayT
MLSMPPPMSPIRIMQPVKGKSSNHLVRKYHRLQREFSGRHLWVWEYFACTTGNVTYKVIKQYIRLQGEAPESYGEGFFVSE